MTGDSGSDNHEWKKGDIVSFPYYGRTERAVVTYVRGVAISIYTDRGVHTTVSSAILTLIKAVAPESPVSETAEPVLPETTAAPPIDKPAEKLPQQTTVTPSPTKTEAQATHPGDVPLPRGIPARLIAGDSWAWMSEVPVVTGVDLSVVLRPRSGGAPVTIPAEIEDGRRVLRVTPSKSAAIAPGAYVWIEVLTRPADGARWTAGEGRVEVLSDPMASGGDLRSHAERILEAIDARLAGRISDDCDAYTIEGRSITRTPLDVLMRVRGIYARQVAAQHGRGGVQFQGVSFR